MDEEQLKKVLKASQEETRVANETVKSLRAQMNKRDQDAKTALEAEARKRTDLKKDYESRFNDYRRNVRKAFDEFKGVVLKDM